MIRILNSRLNVACVSDNFYPDQLLDFHLFKRLACANEVSTSKQVNILAFRQGSYRTVFCFQAIYETILIVSHRLLFLCKKQYSQ